MIIEHDLTRGLKFPTTQNPRSLQSPSVPFNFNNNPDVYGCHCEPPTLRTVLISVCSTTPLPAHRTVEGKHVTAALWCASLASGLILTHRCCGLRISATEKSSCPLSNQIEVSLSMAVALLCCQSCNAKKYLGGSKGLYHDTLHCTAQFQVWCRNNGKNSAPVQWRRWYRQ